MRHFELTLKHELPRTTTRRVYKSISKWLRTSARIVEKAIDGDEVDRHIYNASVYGYSEVLTIK